MLWDYFVQYSIFEQTIDHDCHNVEDGSNTITVQNVMIAVIYLIDLYATATMRYTARAYVRSYVHPEEQISVLPKRAQRTRAHMYIDMHCWCTVYRMHDIVNMLSVDRSIGSSSLLICMLKYLITCIYLQGLPVWKVYPSIKQ